MRALMARHIYRHTMLKYLSSIFLSNFGIEELKPGSSSSPHNSGQSLHEIPASFP